MKLKLTSLKEFAPLIAGAVCLGLIAAVAHAARVDSQAPGKARPMQSESCTPTPTPTPTE